MIGWLVKLFIRNPGDTTSPGARAAYGTLGCVTGVVVNLLLSAIKFLIGSLSGSLAVTADAANNLSDAGASLVSLVSVRLAQKPVDKKHPFGHGRMEYLGTLAVGVLIVIMGVELLKSGIEGIISPSALSLSPILIVALAVSILFKVWLYFFYRNLGGKTNNSTLLASGKDSLSDVLATGAVLLSLILYLIFGWKLDGWISAVVALLVLKSGLSVCKETVDRLLGMKPDPEKVKQLHDELLAREGILGIHDLVLHDYGPGRSIASVHAEVDAKGDVLALHEMIDEAERDVGQSTGVTLCIHMDPIVTDDPVLNDVKEKMTGFLKTQDDRLTLHDFRMVPGQNKISVIFDCLLPPGYKDKEKLLSAIEWYAGSLDQRYAVIVQFDTAFT